MYSGYITRIKNLHKHPNADRLQVGECFGNQVIVSLDYVENQLGVYWPSDGQLCQEYCEINNLLRKKDENGNNVGGYMDANRRVTAVRLRGEPSDGLFMPLTSLANFTTVSDLHEGDAITTLNGVEMCRKYVPPRKKGSGAMRTGAGKAKANFAPTFYEHVDTAQLAYNLNQFRAGDVIELTLKMHGTSGRTGYLPLVRKKKPTWWEKLLCKHPHTYTEYGYVSGTRRVVLDENHSGGYYDDNEFRIHMAAKFEGKLHKGEVVYYEIVGFVNKSTPIMASVANSKISDKAFTKQYGETTVFSYGCDPNGGWRESEDIAPKCEVYVYRMTMVNEDGDVVEYSPDQMRLRCEQMGVKYVPVFERFIVPEFTNGTPNDGIDDSIISPGDYVLHKVEEYFDGPDPIGKTHLREGVVARIVSRPVITVFKHKAFNFKLLEGLIKEVAEAPDMEEAQDEIEDETNL